MSNLLEIGVLKSSQVRKGLTLIPILHSKIPTVVHPCLTRYGNLKIDPHPQQHAKQNRTSSKVCFMHCLTQTLDVCVLVKLDWITEEAQRDDCICQPHFAIVKPQAKS